MEMKTIVIMAGATLMLTSCASIGDPSEDFGSAVRHNIAAQAIEPNPDNKANTYIPADPDRRTLARKRYQEGEIIDPVPINTTQ